MSGAYGFQLSMIWMLYIAVAVVGAALSYRAYTAFRTRPSRPFFLLAAGLGLLTVGMPVGWMGTYLLSRDLFLCTALSIGIALAGTAILLVSIQIRSG